MKPELFSWMNPKLEVRDTKRYGTGIFVTEGLVEQDEILLVMGGYILTTHDESKLNGSLADKPIEIADGFSIGPRRVSDLQRMPQHYVNHSCDPNAGFRGQIFLVAMRPIRTGEEVCYDYAMVIRGVIPGAPAFSLRCSCGAKLCRGTITADDWKNQALQTRYAGYFQWFLQEKIESASHGKS